MPGAVGTNSFWKGIVSWINGDPTQQTVDTIEAAGRRADRHTAPLGTQSQGRSVHSRTISSTHTTEVRAMTPRITWKVSPGFGGSCGLSPVIGLIICLWTRHPNAVKDKVTSSAFLAAGGNPDAGGPRLSGRRRRISGIHQ